MYILIDFSTADSELRSYPQSYGLAQRLLQEGNHMHMAVITSPKYFGNWNIVFF